MEQKKSITISCVMCTLVIFLIGVILFFQYRDANVEREMADTIEDISICVAFAEGKQEIKAWLNPEDGVYYFFLPSGCEKYKMSFANLCDEAVFCLENREYKRDDVLEKIKYKVIYDSKLIKTGEDIQEAQIIFVHSGNLPSMFIETESGTISNIHEDKEIKERGNIVLVDAEGKTEYSSDIEYVKTRGNSTFRDFEKKPYQIKLFKEESLLGMPEDKTWILLANALDDTFLKNELVFRYTQEYTDLPTIHGEYIDLYINGNYVGNYYLCEKVEVDDNRLNITDLEEQTEQVNFQENYEQGIISMSADGNICATAGIDNPTDITGGYLLVHSVFGETMPANSFKTNSGRCYEIVSPNPASMEQAEYICGLFNEMETAMAQEDGVHPETGKHFSEYIDIDSWISKYLIEEVFSNPDAQLQSMYFYKDADSVDPHIFSGPVWDYDRAFGSYGVDYYVIDNPQQVGEYGVYVREMMQHEEVRQQLYQEFDEQFVPYAKYLFAADVYELSQYIKMSAEMDRIRWPYTYGYYSDMSASLDYLIIFLQEKTDYLTEEWLKDTDMCEVAFLDYYGNILAKYNVERGEYLEEVPATGTWTSIFNGWYTVDGGIPLDKRLPVLQDTTYQAQWIDLKIVLANGLNNAGIEAAQADPKVFRELAELLEQMQSEQSPYNNSGEAKEE